MKVVTIAWNSIRRLLRDRTNIFFVLLFPMLLILVLGAAFGGDNDPRVGVVAQDSGELGADLVDRIAEVEGIQQLDYPDRASLVLAVERGQLEAGVFVPPGYDESLRAGEQVTLEWVARPDQGTLALRNTVDSVVTEQGALLRAARFASEKGAADFSEALQTAEGLAEETEGLRVEQRTVGEPFVFETIGGFDLGAYSQLLLFVFITSATGSTALIQSRQLGVSSRMLSTPTSVKSILAGETLGRVSVALFQGLIIILGTALLFDVDWGDPLGAAAVFIVFALGSAGVGMLMGATFKNDQQAGAVGVMVGIGLGALGGAMIPLTIVQIFSPTMYRVAHITPHAWGIRAFEELILYNGTISDIWLELGVLAAFATVVMALGAWRLRVALTKG